jgi:hypothetical protein
MVPVAWAVAQMFRMLLELMQTNVNLNLGDRRNVHVRELNWGEPLPTTLPAVEEVDVVLAADCVYFEVRNPHLPTRGT